MSTDADADTPFYFKSADFPFTDADGDSLAAVIIESVPSAGTLRVDTTAITSSTVPQTVTVGTIPTLNYYPEPGQEPTDPDDPFARYATFNFKVMDDGSGETVSMNSARLGIRLVAPAQVAASGNPTTQPLITAENPTYMVGTQLTATTSGIDEPNDINRETLRWEWQSSSASDGTFAAIASATAITFTPTQALAGQYIRFCVRFMDRHPTPASEGPLCSIPAQVSDVTTPPGDVTTPPGDTATPSGIEGQEVIAILAPTAIAAYTIADAISTAAAPNDLSLDGISMMGAARTLGQSTDPAEQTAWYNSTTANWEYMAAYNATDNSAESLLHRLQSMANGDIALNYSITDTSTMRFWARYQSLDINGNEGESLEYDGSGTGFYLGADNQITDTMRIGLAIGTDSSDISIDLDDDKTNTKDEATRSATSFYPYLHIDLGNNNNARVIAGFGSGTLDIKSTANSNSTASADLSWNMLAASISHHRQMGGRLSARFDGSLQLGNSSTDATTFANGSTLAAADASTNEIAIDAQLRYQSNNFTPFASLAARKLGGDISQSVALDMAFGADLTTNPANLRFAITRQINDTTHQRHSISLDASTKPGASGISASLGSRYDSITGKPQWQSTIGWQRSRHSISLAASPGDYRLQARLRW